MIFMSTVGADQLIIDNKYGVLISGEEQFSHS